jgi:hypothetical protein
MTLLWLVQSGTLFLTPDGLLTRFRDEAVVLNYADACEAVGALRERHQPARAVRLEGPHTDNVRDMGRRQFVAWFAREYPR